MRKNVAGQSSTVKLISALIAGAPVLSATVTVRRCLNNGVQETATGTVTELGNGQYRYDYSQGDTNAESAGFLFTAPNAVAVNLHFWPTVLDPTNAVTGGLGNLAAAVSTRGSQASLDSVHAKADTIAGYLDTEVAAIKVKTDALPSDPADASDIAAAFATVNTKLDTIDDFLDTEVAAIKAKTDALPADPADASDIAASFAALGTKLDAIDDYVDTEVGAIKAMTDALPAQPAAVGSAIVISAAARDSIAVALLKLDLATVVGAATRSMLQAIRAIRNKWLLDDDTLRVKTEDDVTDAWTATVTRRARPPASSIDPS